jgi:hypothetical protein
MLTYSESFEILYYEIMKYCYEPFISAFIASCDFQSQWVFHYKYLEITGKGKCIPVLN